MPEDAGADAGPRPIDRRAFLRPDAASPALGRPWRAARRRCARLLDRHPGVTAGGLGRAGLEIAVAATTRSPGRVDDSQPDRRRPRRRRRAPPLELYNYADYIGPGVVKAFEKKYGVDVKVRVSTFNDTDEAITKIRAGKSGVRHLLPELRPDREDGDGRADPAAQPQLHPEHRQRLAGVHRPLVRRRVRATPCPTASTRPASAGGPTWSPTTWRRCRTPTTSSGTPSYAGKIAVIDDWHTAMAMVALRAGITDINTTKPDGPRRDPGPVLDMQQTTKPKVTITMYNDLPAGQLGPVPDVVRRRRQRAVLPAQGRVQPTCCATGSPRTARGMVDNDLMVVLSAGQEPGARAPVPQPHARRRRTR